MSWRILCYGAIVVTNMKSRFEVVEDLKRLRLAVLSGSSSGGLGAADVDEVIEALEDDAWRERVEDVESDIWGIVAEHDLREVCEFLLENGVTGERWSYDPSPMMIAVESGNLEIVKMMVEHGWSPNHATDVYHESPLTLAASSGNEEMFFYLIEHEAMLEQRWRDMEVDVIGEEVVIGVATLLAAAERGKSSRIVEYLKSKAKGQMT